MTEPSRPAETTSGGRPPDPPIWKEVLGYAGRYLTVVDGLMIAAGLGLLLTFIAPRLAVSAREAREWAALDFTKQLQKMEEDFKAKQPEDAKGYAATFLELAAAGFDLGDLPGTELKRGGYTFRLGVLDSTRKKFFVIAMPDRFGETGARAFYADDTVAIRESPGPVVGPAFPDATEPEVSSS